MSQEPLLRIENLRVHFPVGRRLFGRRREVVHAVNGVSLTLARGETLGIVGESGCGKTTAGMALLDLVPLTAGSIVYRGRDISDRRKLSGQTRLALRKEMQIIFQDPYSSLNPRSSLNRILEVPMMIHGTRSKSERRERIAYLLEKVGLSPDQGQRYPHEFSGGQRQRIGIARALALDPVLIVGDEPVSALDVSIQAQIINLLLDLQAEFDLSYIIIAHDLAVVAYISDRIAVMYLGRVVETAPYADIYSNPRHPYTQALLSAIPVADPRRRPDRIILAGDVPNPRQPPAGCPFHPRCPRRFDGCERSEPMLTGIAGEHQVACHLYR